MKLGLITDIHEHVEHLRTALDRFRTEGADRVVVIGDVIQLGQRIEETPTERATCRWSKPCSSR